MAKPRQIPAEAAIEMATTYARMPGPRAHLAATRRERLRDGQGIDVPVVVAWGEKDRLIPTKARRRDELPPHARFVTLPDCGHVPMWDDPELVAATILEECSSAKAGRRLPEVPPEHQVSGDSTG